MRVNDRPTGQLTPPDETAMRLPDIYDEMPDGADQREYNKRRLIELERDGAARRARIAQAMALSDLCRQVVQAHSPHAL
jgi:hypothetical protein